jgi:hypothetical protein
MKRKNLKLMAGLFLAVVIAMAGALGCSSADAYTTKQLERIAKQSPDEINKELKDKVITIKDFEVKAVMDKTDDGRAMLLSVSADEYDAALGSDIFGEDSEDNSEENPELVVIAIDTTNEELVNSIVGDKITVKAKLDEIVQQEKSYILTFKTLETNEEK